MEFLLTLLFDPNTRWVVTGCMLLGISSGVLGSFALLRKHSLVGDAVAHAALPGICLAYMLYGEKSIGLFMVGATASGLLGTLCISLISKYSRIKPDASLGIVLSVFFGFGTVLLTRIAQTGKANQSGLDAFLFGKAASLVQADIEVMMGVAAFLIIVSFLLFKEFKLLCFDPGFGRGIGFPMGFLGTVLMLMIVLTVVIGLQAVGVVLMAAMLIIPPVAARYWTERLHRMVIISGVFGAASGIVGTLLSGFTPQLPTGPVIVLSAFLLFIVSLFFAPRKGLVAKALHTAKLRRRVAVQNILQSLYDLTEHTTASGIRTDGWGFSEEEIYHLRPQGSRQARRVLSYLKKRGWVQMLEDNQGNKRWALTDRGADEAYAITLNERLYEMILMYPSRFGSVKLEQEGDRIQDCVSPDILQELKLLLTKHNHPVLLPQVKYGADLSYTECHQAVTSRGGDA
jgi:manganese/zinc/iron transport system permease protein